MTLSSLAFIFVLFFLMALASANPTEPVAPASEADFVYDEHSQLYPYWPLVTAGGAIVIYETKFAVAEMVLEASGKDVPIKIAMPGMGVEYSGDGRRLQGEFPDFEFTDMKESIEMLFAWYETNKSQIDGNLLLMDK